MKEKTALYRMYDSQEALLYVGVSENLATRIDQHRSGKKWFGSVCLIEVEWFSTRKKAVAAEGVAIKRERPIYNVSAPVQPRVRRKTVVPERIPSSDEDQDQIASDVIEKLGYSIATLSVVKTEESDVKIGRPPKLRLTDSQEKAAIALWHCPDLKRSTVIRWVSKFQGQPVKGYWVRDLVIKHTGSAARDENAEGKRSVSASGRNAAVRRCAQGHVSHG